MQVLKFQLDLQDADQTFHYSEPFEVVHIGMQHGFPTVWFIADPDAIDPEHLVTRTFKVVATGAFAPRDYDYVGTAQDQGQSMFVWHVFEKKDYA